MPYHRPRGSAPALAILIATAASSSFADVAALLSARQREVAPQI